MNPPSPPKSFSRRLQLRLAKARFFTFSALIHLVLVILGGSVVLIKNIPEAPDFEAGDGGLIAPESAAAQPPAAPPASDSPQFTPPAPSVSAPSLQALTASTLTPSSFQMASIAAPTANLDSKLNNLASATSDRMGERMSAMAGNAARGGGNFFGSRERTVNALVGTFYDLKQFRSRKPAPITPPAKTEFEEFERAFRVFVNGGWNRSILNEYYKSSSLLYSAQIFIPVMSATEGPKAFDVEKEVEPGRWVALYKGRVSPPEDGVYHFVGFGDDVLVVRFNENPNGGSGHVVLDACWQDRRYPKEKKKDDWQAARTYDYGWPSSKSSFLFGVGDALNLKAGQFYDVDILIGERGGGLFSANLLVEKEGETYQKDARGNPILPPFRLVDGPPPEPQPGQTFPPFQANGPVWKAAAVKSGTSSGSALDNFFGPK